MRLNKHLAAMTIVLAASCGMMAWQTSSNAGPHDATPGTQPSKEPMNKFCAVEREDKVDPAVTVEYDGKVVGFCCKDCVAKFKADPAKYMKDLK